MDINQLKNKAAEYAKQFVETENFDLNLTENNYTPAEWFLIGMLSQVYYNLLKDVYTREQAKDEQIKIINFVYNNQQMFEFMEDENEQI